MKTLPMTDLNTRSGAFRFGIAAVFSVAFACTNVVQAQTPEDYQEIYKASLAIDHIRDLIYGSGDRQVARSYAGLEVVSRLSNQNPESPTWSADTLLNEASTGQYQLWIYKSHGPSKLNFSIFSDPKTMYLAFWGTTKETEGGNLALAVFNPAYDNSQTHAGWAAMAYDNYDMITREMTAQGAASKRIVVTGHSQGGAVAGHLMYLMLKNKYLNRDKNHLLVGFGAPRYGTVSFRKNFHEHLRGNAPQTKAFDVEIEEDSKVTLWSDIVSLSLGNEGLYTGTRIRRPKAFSGRTLSNDDPHNHLYYVYVSQNLAYPGGSLSRPKTDISSVDNLKSTQLAESADKISVTHASGASNKVTIVLQAHNNITWWKAVKIYQNGRMIKELYTQDGRREDRFVLDVKGSDSYHLEFCKAKAFGVRTSIKKHSVDLFGIQGTLTFQWTKD